MLPTAQSAEAGVPRFAGTPVITARHTYNRQRAIGARAHARRSNAAYARRAMLRYAVCFQHDAVNTLEDELADDASAQDGMIFFVRWR